MCQARFSEATGQPIITASVVIPELEQGIETNFVVDTGADNTAITELDAFTGTIHPFFLPDDFPVFSTTSKGVGGDSETYLLETEVLVAFEDYDNDRERFSLHIEHIPYLRISTGSPSNLLGRDIIDRFRMDYNPGKGFIEMKRDNFAEGRYQCIAAQEEMAPNLREFGPE